MFKEEGNHGELVTYQEDTMEGIEHMQQENKEVDFLSDFEDCFDGEDPEEITSFYPPSFTFQACEPAAIKENIQ
ncbi:hypothetical protein KI387_006553, partial [Taxus chinensis]